MRIRNNEHGGALAMVLMLIVVFAVLGMGLLTMNISATKQFHKKEEQVQARHIAEMGILHYKADVKKIVEDNNRELLTIISRHNPNDKISESLQSKIDTQNKKSCLKLGNPNLEHPQIEIKTMKGFYQTFIKTKNDCINNKEIIVRFKSIGRVNEVTKEIDAKIVIANNSSTNGDSIPQPPKSDETDYKDKSFSIPDNKYTPKKPNLYIKGNLSYEPGNEKTNKNVIIPQDLYVEGKIDFKNHSCIVVKNNLTVLGSINLGPHITIIVYGNAYFPGVQNENGNNGNNGNNGIYVIGNVFVNGNKESVKNLYKEIPKYGSGNHSCPRPNDLPTPKSEDHLWAVKPGLNAEYK